MLFQTSMIKDLIREMEEHTQRNQVVYQQHLDILQGRLLDRNEKIKTLNKQLSKFKGTQHISDKEQKDQRLDSIQQNSQEFEQSLKQSRRQLSVLFRTKIARFEQLIGHKTSKSQNKTQRLQITTDHHQKLLMEIAHLRNHKQIYQRQLQAQAKLINQYQAQNTQRIKQFRIYKQTSKQQYKNETRKIIDLYNQKHKQLITNYTRFFTQLTSFVKNQLNLLKRQSINNLADTWQILTNSLIKFSEEIPYRSSLSKVTNQDSSILSKQQILEFQLQELRKQLLAIKAENCVMKFQLKKKDDKKSLQAKTQPLYDKNKFFGEDTFENDFNGLLKIQKSRKDSSRAFYQKDCQEHIREDINYIKDKITNLNNSEIGRKSLTKKTS